MGDQKSVTTGVVNGGGKNPVWAGNAGLAEFSWEGEEDVEIVIRDKDSGSLLWDDKKIGACLINVGTLAKMKTYTGTLNVYRQGTNAEGTLHVALRCDHVLPCQLGTLLEPTPAKTHKNLVVGAVAALEGGETPDVFTTYEIAVQRVTQVFGDNRSSNIDADHQKLFNDPLKKAVQAEHSALYSDSVALSYFGAHRYEKYALSTGSQLLSLLGFGIRQGKRRVFTYVLLDSGLFFSETGAKLAKDFLSKHAVHANASREVRMAGTFRICESRAGSSVLVADNDSGTYRPNAEDLPLLREVLELNFPGLHVRALSVLEAQSDDTKDFIGPNEVPKDKQCVYAGQWRWRTSAAESAAITPSVTEQCQGIWEWKSGRAWRRYRPEDEQLLEKLSKLATSGSVTTHELSFGRGGAYEFDFANGIQHNKVTGRDRRIRHIRGSYIPAWEVRMPAADFEALGYLDSINLENAYLSDAGGSFELSWNARQLCNFDFARMECSDALSTDCLRIRRLQSTSVDILEPVEMWSSSARERINI